MKKSSVALGVIIALGAGWTGSAWYTGKSVETYLDQRIEMVNNRLASLGTEASHIKFDHVKIERGIFSSRVQYDVVATFPDNTFKIPFEGTLYHGPFPLDRLRQFHFSPVLLSSQDGIVKNAETQAWFDYAQGKNPMVNKFSVSYDSKFSGSSELAALHFPLEDVDLQWKGAVLRFDAMTDQGAGKLNGVIDGLHIEVKATEKSGAVSIVSDKIQFENDLQESAWKNILLGKQKVKLDQLRFSQAGDNTTPVSTMVYKNVVLEGETAKQGEFVDYKLKGHFPDVLLNNIQLADIAIGMDFTHLEGNTLNQLLALLEKNEASEAVSQELQTLLKKLAENAASLRIKPLTLSTDSGTAAKADALIEMASVDFDVLEQGKLFSLFKQFELNADIHKTALVDFIAGVEQATSGKTKEQTMEQAKFLVDSVIADLTSNGVLMDKGENSSFKLILENGELKLNEQVIPEDQVLMSLLLLFLGMGS